VKSVNELIQQLDDFFSDESRWTQNAFARRSDGLKTNYNDPHACKWCLFGGAAKIFNTTTEVEELPKVLNAIDEKIGRPGIAQWNDNPKRTFADLKNLFKELINEYTPRKLESN
jgi:hypothetical protein